MYDDFSKKGEIIFGKQCTVGKKSGPCFGSGQMFVSKSSQAAFVIVKCITHLQPYHTVYPPPLGRQVGLTELLFVSVMIVMLVIKVSLLQYTVRGYAESARENER